MPVLQYYLSIGALILLALDSLRRVLLKKAFFGPFSVWAVILLYLGSFGLLGWYFYAAHIKAGVLAVCMAATAVGKYMLDLKKN